MHPRTMWGPIDKMRETAESLGEQSHGGRGNLAVAAYLNVKSVHPPI